MIESFRYGYDSRDGFQLRQAGPMSELLLNAALIQSFVGVASIPSKIGLVAHWELGGHWAVAARLPDADRLDDALLEGFLLDRSEYSRYHYDPFRLAEEHLSGRRLAWPSPPRPRQPSADVRGLVPVNQPAYLGHARELFAAVELAARQQHYVSIAPPSHTRLSPLTYFRYAVIDAVVPGELDRYFPTFALREEPAPAVPPPPGAPQQPDDRLDQLEAAMAELRSRSDASHTDLRGEVGQLRARLDSSSLAGAQADSLRAALADCRENLERILTQAESARRNLAELQSRPQDSGDEWRAAHAVLAARTAKLEQTLTASAGAAKEMEKRLTSDVSALTTQWRDLAHAADLSTQEVAEALRLLDGRLNELQAEFRERSVEDSPGNKRSGTATLAILVVLALLWAVIGFLLGRLTHATPSLWENIAG